MSDNDLDYGYLIKKDIKLHRIWFKQMARAVGVNCTYRAPKPGKRFDEHGDLDTNYMEPEKVGCIFDQYPDQKSMKKAGWVAELQEGSSVLHVPYDLHDIQVGALFWIPAGIDFAEPRAFRVISMSNIMIYPASIACEIAPEFEDVDDNNLINDFSTDNFTLVNQIEGDD